MSKQRSYRSIFEFSLLLLALSRLLNALPIHRMNQHLDDPYTIYGEALRDGKTLHAKA
jgi:hypothetical protein